jgi:hypothetical protein
VTDCLAELINKKLGIQRTNNSDFIANALIVHLIKLRNE